MKELKESRLIFERGKHIAAQDRDDLDRFPCYIHRGKGAYVWDYDGNQYLDFTCGKGAVILGYSNDEVDQAVMEQIKNNGNIFFTQYSDIKLRLAEKLVEHIPCAERVMFFKTGSASTSAAIRVARVYTGKDIIITCGYHGWHDWSLHLFPEFKSYDNEIIEFNYDLQRLYEIFETHRGNVAGLIITPEPNFFSDAFLHKAREITKAEGVPLIFDEVKTGFRFTLGGYQKYCGVIPDMATFSKGLANGYGISAVVGKREILEAAMKTHLWGTYHAELIPMVAAIKTIEILENSNVLAKMWETGAYFISKLEELFLKYQLPMQVYTHPTVFHIVVEEDLGKAFFHEALEQGILFYPFDNQMISSAHEKTDIDEAIKRLEKVAEKLCATFPEKRGNTIEQGAIDHYTLNEFGGVVTI